MLAKFIIGAMLMTATFAQAELVRQSVDYKQGDTALEGYIVYDDAQVGPRPGVLVIHDWYGLGENPKGRADQLAALGYIAFACDIYGKGKQPSNNDEAKAMAGQFYDDVTLLRARAQAGLDYLMNHPLCDTLRVAAIGYCFGGRAALELARSGANLAGTVSFHGGLKPANPTDAKNIKGKILALHGADDPYVPAEDVAAFETEMRAAGVDWQLVKYGGAVHAFTIKTAGNDPSKGAAYNETADRRSWQAMKDFFDEIFSK